MGLNLIYEGVQEQILNREKIPDLESAIDMIADEELRMNVNSGMKNGSESQTTPEAAFVARKSDGRFNPKNNAQSSQLSSSHQITILEMICFATIARRSDIQKILSGS